VTDPGVPPPALRLARFAGGDREFFALLEGSSRLRPIDGDPFASEPVLDALIRAAAVPGTGSVRALEGLSWLAPCSPSKIIGVGRNYREHAAELKHPLPEEPLLFLKPPSAVLPPGGAIRLPAVSRRVDYEGELGVVIGRTARAVPESEALDHVLGYTCVNDVTARDLQAKDVQFTRAKGFDTFCPFGPCIATGLDPAHLVVETFVNGAKRQSSAATRMIFGVARLVSFISHAMTLYPGDLIATGTPEGVGPLQPGDEVTVSVEGIGRLTNRAEGGVRPRP
jgi:2-keto-4-pentenoate hydratase/2-oxohepta-3-ene-1,7-dioic acid hydratase in catechol pathway